MKLANKHVNCQNKTIIINITSKMIAIHCGAGKYNENNSANYRKLCNRACRRGIEVLNLGGTALEAVTASVKILENDPLTNSGYGSNLTNQGVVECDAAVMDGATLLYGGCGAVKKVKNPIELAQDICLKQLIKHPMGLVAPSLLVGSGALEHAKAINLKTVRGSDMISSKALRQYNKYKHFTAQCVTLQIQNNNKLDTVGAVCVDRGGHVATGCSSGGLLLKRPGRVGQGALFGSGVWADSYAKDTETSIAICTTGCGEDIVKTNLAKEIADDLKNCDCPTTALSKSMTKKFLDSRFLYNVIEKNCGALVAHVTNTGQGTVLWGHSTDSMWVGYMKLTDTKPKSFISSLPKDVKGGTTITVGGAHFNIIKNS